MNGQLINDFKSYLKLTQPPPSRPAFIIILGLSLLTYGEIASYQMYDSLQVIGCSEPVSLESSSYTDQNIGTCITGNIPQCIHDQYSTSSNSTLTFAVPFQGVPTDRYGKLIAVGIILSYILFMGVYQSSHVFSYLKKKRIQDILAESGVYLFGAKTIEISHAVLVLTCGLTYLGCKVLFILNREIHYQWITCGDIKYQLTFTLSLSSFLGPIMQSLLIYTLMTLGMVAIFMNYLSDMDFRNLMSSISPRNFAELANLLELDIHEFQKQFEKYIDEKYYDSSFILKLKRKWIYIFSITSNQEISEFILNYYSKNPQNFKMMVDKERPSNYSIQVNNNEGENESLLN